MQAVQLATAVLALAAFASAFPGYSESTSHVSQSLGVGGIGGHISGGGGGYESHGQEDYGYHNPEYKYDYAVHDPHTGDVKSASESRHGDAVRGSYTLHDADGHVRTVEYTADKHTGFQAVVKKGSEVTVHGYGEQDKQNVASAGHAAAAGASYSQAVNHGGYSGGGGYGKGVSGGYGAGLGHASLGGAGLGHASLGGAGLGHAGLGHAQASLGGHGY